MTNPELLTGIGLLIGAGTAINGFLFRMLFRKVDEMKTCLHSNLEKFPKEYQSKEDCLLHKNVLDSINRDQYKLLREHGEKLAKLNQGIG